VSANGLSLIAATAAGSRAAGITQKFTTPLVIGNPVIGNHFPAYYFL
jgi:hypothetical protein